PPTPFRLRRDKFRARPSGFGETGSSGGLGMAERLVGTNYITPDIVAKVTGRARYAEDFRADGMLFCKLMLSERPHARIRGIDTSRALKLEGVRAIITADDVPQLGGTTEHCLTKEPLYAGEPILAVAVISE